MIWRGAQWRGLPCWTEQTRNTCLARIVPNHSAFRKRNPTGRIILPSGNQRTILAPIPGSGPSDSMRSSAALLEKKSASVSPPSARAPTSSIHFYMSYPSPETAPQSDFLVPTQGNGQASKIQRKLTRSWRQDERNVIRCSYRDSTNTAGPAAPDRSPEKGDAKSSAISASQNYWRPHADSGPSGPHPPAATATWAGWPNAFSSSANVGDGKRSLKTAKRLQEILTTFLAWRPFGPSTTSKLTRSPSFRVLSPSAMMEVWWTKTSVPRSRTMKPKPLPSLNHFTVPCSGILLLRSPLFKLARVLVCFNHVSSGIVNANHGIMWAAVLAGVADCIAGSVRSVIPEPTERQRIGNQIDATMIFARADFVHVRCLHRIGLDRRRLLVWNKKLWLLTLVRESLSEGTKFSKVLCCHPPIVRDLINGKFL